MKSAEVGMIFRYAGELHEVIGTSNGRHVHILPVHASPCPTCGHRGDKEFVERAPLFQDHAEPVDTLR